FRLPISSGFSFSASGDFFCAEWFGVLVFCGGFCAETGAARRKRLNPSHKLRRADGNLIVILLAVKLPWHDLAIRPPRGASWEPPANQRALCATTVVRDNNRLQ